MMSTRMRAVAGITAASVSLTLAPVLSAGAQEATPADSARTVTVSTHTPASAQTPSAGARVVLVQGQDGSPNVSRGGWQWPPDTPPHAKIWNPRGKRVTRMSRVINGVPRRLKHHLRHTRAYHRRLARALARSHNRHSRMAGSQRISWLGCGWSVAKFLLENGFLPAKFYRVWKRLKEFYGSGGDVLRAAAYAIKNGNWAPLIHAGGEEAPEIVESLMGAGDLVDHCF